MKLFLLIPALALSACGFSIDGVPISDTLAQAGISEEQQLCIVTQVAVKVATGSANGSVTEVAQEIAEDCDIDLAAMQQAGVNAVIDTITDLLGDAVEAKE